MNFKRTSFVWFMLFAALTFAVPRAWLHNCIGEHAAHELQDENGNTDSVDHGECAACVFSFSSSLVNHFEFQIEIPVQERQTYSEPITVFAECKISAIDLRGPPQC